MMRTDEKSQKLKVDFEEATNIEIPGIWLLKACEVCMYGFLIALLVAIILGLNGYLTMGRVTLIITLLFMILFVIFSWIQEVQFWSERKQWLHKETLLRAESCLEN